MANEPLEITGINFGDKLQQLENSLGEFKSKYNQIAKAAFREVMNVMRKETRELMKGTSFKRYSGQSSKGLNYYAFPDGATFFTTSRHTKYWEDDKTQRTIKAGLDENGKQKYLTFKIKGNWRKVKQVTLGGGKDRKTMTPVFMSFLQDGSKTSKAFDDGIQKALERIFKKIAEVK